MDDLGNDSDASVELSFENVDAAIKSLGSISPRTEDSPDFQVNGSDVNRLNKDAYVTIIEEPQSRGFRFRYKCEGPSHGGLQGVNSEKGKKSYPAIQIMNYEGPAKILVSLVTNDPVPKTHAHELVGKSCNRGICLIDVKEAKNPICQFQNIGVMHVTKRKVSDVLKERILESMLLNKRISSGNVNDENIQLNEYVLQPRRLAKIGIRDAGVSLLHVEVRCYAENSAAKKQADSQAKNMQLNVVRLCFQAYIQDKNGNFTIMLPSVISKPIFDSKSPGAAALKICRMDKCGGCCIGNEEVFLLCEKVQKDDIKVYFIELDQDQRVVWKQEADFGPMDVHKQYAIVFRTPQYRNINIKDPVKVLIKLERPSDEECSEPKAFTYFPQNPDEDDIDKKRRKILPQISDADNLFPHSEWNPPSLYDSPFQFSNGAADNTNYKSHQSDSSYPLFDSAANNTNYKSHQSDPFYPLFDSSLFGDSLTRYPDTKFSLEAMDDSRSDDLETDCQPCNSSTLQPYMPMIFVDEQNQLKEGKTLKSESHKIKEDDYITILKTKYQSESSEKVKELSSDIKSECFSDDSLSKDMESKLSLEATDETQNDKSELELPHEYSSIMKPHKAMIFTGEESPQKEEKECLKIQSFKIKEAEIDILKTGHQTETSKETKKLPSDIKTEPISDLQTPNEKHGSVSEILSSMKFFVALRRFCASGNLKELLDSNKNLLLIPDKYGDNCLHLALINNQPDVVKNLMPVVCSSPEDLNVSNHRFQTYLHLAVLTNQPEMVELFLKQGASRTLVDCNGNTAVHLAVKYNYTDCLKLLLNPKFAKQSAIDPFPELDMLNLDGYSPLHLACLKGFADCVNLLVEANAEVDLPDGKSGRTPLHIVVENNDLLLAGKLLLEAESDTTCTTFDGNTPLHLACGRHYDTMVALLISVGANPEATSGINNWYPSDDSDFESYDDGPFLLDATKGIRPRDLVSNDEKILRLLDGEPYTRSIIATNSDVTQSFEGDLDQLSDQMRLNLANLIESSKGKQIWKTLAKLLQVEYLIDTADKSVENPSLYILEMYETIGGHMVDLYSAFVALEMNDAACLLKNLIQG